MKKILSALFLCACLLFGTVFAAAEKPEINAKAAMLIERNSGEILFEQNADEKVYPASLTKIMTALLILENCRLTDRITVPEAAFADIDASGSTADLQPGEELSVEQLLYCTMLSSANEACNVAAVHIDGSIEAFVARMNQRAAELGCTGTHFVNAHGLHNEEHYTTARDLSRITLKALENNAFRTIVSTPKYAMDATNLHKARKLTTTNQMIIDSETNRYYDSRVSGVKTGFTTPAGRCLIATAESAPLRLLSIVCGCETTILESGDLEFGSFPETSKLINYGFDAFTYQTVLNTLYPVAEMPVSRSSGANFVSLAPKEEVSVLLPSDYDESKIVYDVKLISENGVTAPVDAGEELGTITVKYGGKALGSTKLVSIARVERATLLTFLKTGISGSQGWLRSVLLILILGACLVGIVWFVYRILTQRKKRSKRRHDRRPPHELGRSDWFEREDRS
ncbi:MAG: D-alanyl-D-alanine carboxypeptidase [Oscillospiraceae bacterium]|nr:D-alanyl-D-alanine carboxypeptidase [Oscillospiraceae bacterium]